MYPRKFYYFYFPSLAILLMWLSKTTEYFLDLDFKTYGIFPREIMGLRGIFLTPFIHDNFNHLISNTMPFFFLSMAIFYFYRKSAIQIILSCWFLTNIAVWLGGRYAWHIGASGLVYAFASFLFFSGILGKDRRMIALSLLVIFLYGGMIWGIFPGQINISWESHLFGFLSGFIMAFYLGKKSSETKIAINTIPKDDFTSYNSTHENEMNISYHFKEKDE
jgi:membrane associated rhomboid family serine protease